MGKTMGAVLCALILTSCKVPVGQTLAKGNRIGVLVAMNPQAEFKYVTELKWQNYFYSHKINDFDPNEEIQTELCDLLNDKGYQTVPISILKTKAKTAPEILLPSFGRYIITKTGSDYFMTLRETYHLNYLLFIAPDRVSYGVDQDNLTAINGYGVFYRHFLRADQLYLAAAYQIFLIDIDAFAVVGHTFGKQEIRTTPKIWRDDYAKIRSVDQDYLGREFRSMLLPPIKNSIIYLLQLNRY